jgi:2,4-dienoyl-CoA reductase-like NADH-dependent reductase (Old Yellow Enzyme family)
MTSPVFKPISLASGLTLQNRLVKAAMEENMSAAMQKPSTELMRLYKTWADGGVGLIITGNVMIDHLAMTGPGGVALEKGADLSPFKDWAKVAQSQGCKVIMQINHPGRQVFKKMGGKVLSPSDIPLNMGKHSHMFAKPSAMTEAEIQDVIARFATTAKLAQSAGFDGVEIHAAHGYLISQFLSPLSNKRNDQWGGTIENRARLLVDVIDAIKAEVDSTFSVSIKLNSADFQRGGFDVDDAKQVLSLLSDKAIDFVELSGGSYEAPAMQGKSADQRTLAREAYFLEFAEQLTQFSSIPIMVTGGIRRLAIAEQVLDAGVSLVGMASALASSPNLPNTWKNTPDIEGTIFQVNWKDKTLSGLAVMAMVKQQLRRLGQGKKPKLNPSASLALVKDQINAAKLTKRYRRQYKNELT